MSEVLEHELNQLRGTVVVIVRPYFGSQSDSWCGTLTTLSNFYPLKFHVTSPELQTLFTANDVSRIDHGDATPAKRAIIRLKGPQDYVNPPVLRPLDVS